MIVRSHARAVFFGGGVDQRISPEQSGVPDTEAGGDSVNYLRRLRGDTPEGESADTRAIPTKAEIKGRTVPDTVGAGWKERRLSPRTRCSGSAEFRAEGETARIWGTLTDVSLHGCYVEMSTTFVVGTNVDIVLKSCGIQIHVSGTVRACYPSLGMGIGFGELPPNEELHLKQLLSALAGRGPVSYLASAKIAVPEAPPTVNSKDFLDAVTSYFQNHPTLSREEFYRMSKKIRGL
jgi:PilZ domain-containing protein